MRARFAEMSAPAGLVPLFSWVGDYVTEHQVIDTVGETVRIAVLNSNGKVVRSAYVKTGAPANLDAVPGLVRKCRGPLEFWAVP